MIFSKDYIITLIIIKIQKIYFHNNILNSIKLFFFLIMNNFTKFKPVEII